ncbi:MAG: hypothetical protein KZQ95_11085 [Candidatus Thiodiazotropha sp. (ex Epidulcina cf. delphinae)]|nr:hypothetical protein [Candidatus Thiodiazotropha sp. (ex Epidulcina cf. delphinae)]
MDHLLRQIGSKGPYTRCAFAVELHTNPRTRNGFSRIRQYESHDTSAFALMKKPIPCPPFRVLSSSAEPAMDTSLVKERTE